MIIIKTTYLEGQPEGLVSGPAGGDDGVEGLEEGHAVGLALLPLNVPALKARESQRVNNEWVDKTQNN